MYTGDRVEEPAPPGEQEVIIDHLRPRPGVPRSPDVYREEVEPGGRRSRSPDNWRRRSQRSSRPRSRSRSRDNRRRRSRSRGNRSRSRSRERSSRRERSRRRSEEDRRENWDRSTEAFLRQIGEPKRILLPPPSMHSGHGYGSLSGYSPSVYPQQQQQPMFDMSSNEPSPGYSKTDRSPRERTRHRPRDESQREREGDLRTTVLQAHKSSRPKDFGNGSSSISPSPPPPPLAAASSDLGDLRELLSRRQRGQQQQQNKTEEEEEYDIGMQDIIQERERTELLRRELEKEKQRLLEMQQKEERVRRQEREAIGPPPPPRPPTPPRLSNNDWRTTTADSRLGRHNFGGGAAAAAEQEDLNQTVVKPGNYLIVCWDAESLGGSVSNSNSNNSGGGGGGSSTFSFHQLGAFLPHGVGITQCILPSTDSEEDGGVDEATFEQLKKKIGLFSRGGKIMTKVNHQPVETVDTKEALERLLSFMEKGCESARPRYDGVLMLSHLQEIIPGLLKAVGRNGLWDRFCKTVVGIGDLCTYLARCHMKRFLQAQQQLMPDSEYDKGATAAAAAAAAKDVLTLESVYANLFSERLSFQGVCEKKARATYFILEKLLEGKPSYSNFFSKFLHPLGSKLIQKMVNFKTVRERVDLFLPLQLFISRELSEQRVELIMEGVYAPSAEDEDQYLSEPQQVALAMCRILVAAGFDFDHLIRTYNAQGLAEVELKLRTAFLDKMAGQPRAVVDQTIKTTRLVVKFFKQHGHRSVEELTIQAKQQRAVEQQAAIEAKNVAAAQASSSSSAPPTMIWKKYYPVASYFLKSLRRRTTIVVPNSSDEDLQSMAIQMVQALQEASISLESLQSNFATQPQPIFGSKLMSAVGPSFYQYGPPEVRLETFVDLVAEFLGSSGSGNVDHPAAAAAAASGGGFLNPMMRQSSSYHDSSSSSVVPLPSSTSKTDFDQKKTLALEIARHTLDQSISASYRFESALSDFRHRLFSLAVVKMHLVQSMEPMAALCGGNVEHVHLIGDHVCKLLAFLGYNHARLRELWAVSQAALAANILSGLRINPGLLPPGFTNDSLVEHVVNYCKSSSSTGGASTARR